MNVAFSKPMTLAEFLNWEEQQRLRYEFDGFQAVAMTGGTAAHADIQANIAASLRGRLRGKPCKYLDDAILSLPEIGIEVPLAELYEGLALGIPGDVKETGRTD